MLSIIGCGNPNRCDDGMGVFVAQELQKYLELKGDDCVKVYDAGTSGMDVMFQARGSNKLIIIDANSSDSEPGQIYKVPGKELENLPEPSYNLHDFRWDHALYAGKRIYKDDFPEDVQVYLVEVKSLDMGIGLSEIVEAASRRVVGMIKIEIDAYIAAKNV